MKTEKEIQDMTERLEKIYQRAKAEPQAGEMLASVLALQWTLGACDHWGQMVDSLWNRFVARERMN